MTDGLIGQEIDRYKIQTLLGIGGMATVLLGEVNAIYFTGGLAQSKLLTGWIADRTDWIAPVLVYPGQDELEALALGALRVLRGSDRALEYIG